MAAIDDLRGEMARLTARVAELENLQYEKVETVVDVFAVTNVTETRTLDATAATLLNIKNFVATLVQDIKKRGANRAE